MKRSISVLTVALVVVGAASFAARLDQPKPKVYTLELTGAI